MSFGFGNTNTFGSIASNANKPTGFGTAFGATSSSTTPAFGLGSNTAATSTGFTGFGTTPATTSFGFGGFGTTATTTTTAPAAFGTFGGGNIFGSTTTTPAATGFSGFGTTPTATPASTFTFGASVPASTAISGFGGFGANPFGGTSTGSTGLFGSTTNTTNTGFGSFGSSFGAKPNLGFGLGSSTFGQTLQQPQQAPQPVDPNAAFYNSIFNCQIFGDERDTILGKWNLIQALWGSGKGFYNHQAPPVDYDQKNPFCRFKAIVYNTWSKHENKEGLVALVFNKKESELRPLETQLVANLSSILGNKPNLHVTIERIRPASDTKSTVLFSVQEKTANGSIRKVPANELAAFLINPMQKQQLTNLQVENLYPMVDPSSEMLREYLDAPPAGIDQTVWQQGQEENPVPDRLIPVPIFGFNEVRVRMKNQENEAGLQLAFLDKMSDEIGELHRKLTATEAANFDYKAKLVELQRRILRVVMKQEKVRKIGLILTPEEEAISSRLDALSSLLNSNAFKKRLSDLTEGVKTQGESNKYTPRYKMDPGMVSEVKQFLSIEQSGMTQLIETIQSDLSNLKVVKDGLTSLIKGGARATV